MPATANDFTARRSGDSLRVTGMVSAPSSGWSAALEITSAAIEHDPAELRLALTASKPTNPSADEPTEVGLDRTFDVDPAILTHVVISLVGDIEAPRYSGDSLNIPID